MAAIPAACYFVHKTICVAALETGDCPEKISVARPIGMRLLKPD
jgi:hypothetical protein